MQTRGMQAATRSQDRKNGRERDSALVSPERTPARHCLCFSISEFRMLRSSEGLAHHSEADVDHPMNRPAWNQMSTSLSLAGHTRMSRGKGSACQCRRQGFHPWVRRIPRRRKRQPTPAFSPAESHGKKPGGLQSIRLQRVRMTDSS